MLSDSRLGETSFDAVDAVKLEIPKGFKFLKPKMINTFKIIEK